MTCYTATLGCGSILVYESPSFVPSTGETVPCRSHGYCLVVRRGRDRAARSSPRHVSRARPRQREELVNYLESCPVTSVPNLRRERFTLRLIADAERDGLLTVDETTGTVVWGGVPCGVSVAPCNEDP